MEHETFSRNLHSSSWETFEKRVLTKNEHNAHNMQLIVWNKRIKILCLKQQQKLYSTKFNDFPIKEVRYLTEKSAR